jgi:replication fork protection complex subunit Tof1/Swi1
MFSNAKLRLLMGLVGFERVGMEDVPGAAWVVPAPLSSKDLRETVSTVNKSLLNPMPEGGDEDPRQLLRRKERGSARQSLVQGTLDVNFGSDSEGEDTVPDGPLFPPNPRSKANALDELKKKRKTKKKSKDDAETEPLDDETLEARREARLSNALARQAKIKSDLFIHASDEESDAEADEEFFRLEEERRKKQAENVKKALLTGTLEKAKGKKKGKRKSGAGTTTAEPKRQRRGSGSVSDAVSDADGDILMAELDALSPGSPQEVSASHGAQDEDTPITSAVDDMDFDDDLVFSRDRQSKAAPEADADDEDTLVVPTRRRMRGGFVIESDSE